MVSESTDAPLHITLVGNPNVGKSTLFNALVGANSRISNYPGITADSVIGEFFGAQQLRIVTDLPGTYSLELNLPEAQLCHQHLKFDVPPQSEQQNLIIVVIEAVGFPRNFQLLAQLMALGVPMAVVVTKTAEAQLRGYQIQLQALEESLGIPVVEAAEKSAMRTLDVEALIAAARIPTPVHPDQESIEQWSSDLLAKTSLPVRPEQARRRRRRDDRLDRVLVHPIAGSVLFLLAMICMFGSVYWMAQVPMEWIDVAFGTVGGWISTSMEDGPLRGLLVDGVIGGISGTMVFLPQILLLFFLISLLEETGYMARAAFVADRWLRPFGLPGQAFVPLLSSHACAIPGILCTRLIPDRRDRLATILVAPFLSCSARLPVYILMVGILAPTNPLVAGCVFVGCYLLGALVAVGSAGLVRKTLLTGPSLPMVLELPPYRLPSIGDAARIAIDRGWTFLKNAGSVILLICIALWWLSAYPTTPEGPEIEALRVAAEAHSDPGESQRLLDQAQSLHLRESARGSYAGQLGRWIEPVLAPIGADWQLSVAILASFAAREVFVSSLNVMVGVREEEAAASSIARIRASTRDDGSPLLPPAAAGGLLVFYILAMQCLPTLVVTSREAGGIRWALLQLIWMTSVAWILGVVARQWMLAAGFSG
ncbi:MAG: ferrous iron transporter B [Planctomycetota bacterium]|jgi:ferrous iron transport protein B|nr:ferrous iron transporter B [Planctomycetota bacterium]